MTALRTNFPPQQKGQNQKPRLAMDSGFVDSDDRRKCERRSGALSRRGRDRRPAGSAADAGTRPAAEMALAESRAELEALLESAIDAIVGTDADQRILIFNSAACRMFRCTAREALGLPLGHFIQDDIPAMLAGTGLGPYTGRRRDGERFPVEAAFARLEAAGQGRLLVTLRDISERQAAEQALKRLQGQMEAHIRKHLSGKGPRTDEALARSNLKLQQFAYVAAHDLQAPLRSIYGFATMLQNECTGRLGTQGDTWLDYLLRATRRMQNLVQDLLAYSQLDSHGNPFEATDLSRVFDDVVLTLDATIRESGAQVSRDELPMVWGDRIQLEQLLQNLITNGIKYRGDRTPRVHVSVRRGSDEWVVSVRDNGIGIPKPEMESIFELFRRLHTQQEYPGTGIGLAVCRRVVHRHGGRIWVESQPGKGSEFIFTVPDKESENP